MQVSSEPWMKQKIRTQESAHFLAPYLVVEESSWYRGTVNCRHRITSALLREMLETVVFMMYIAAEGKVCTCTCVNHIFFPQALWSSLYSLLARFSHIKHERVCIYTQRMNLWNVITNGFITTWLTMTPNPDAIAVCHCCGSSIADKKQHRRLASEHSDLP